MEIVTALFFGSVHGHIGCFHQGFRGQTIGRIEADTDAGGDVQFVSIDVKGRGQGLKDLLGNDGDFAGFGVLFQSDDKLIAAEPSQGVRFSHDGAQAFGDLLQNLIPHLMA